MAKRIASLMLRFGLAVSIGLLGASPAVVGEDPSSTFREQATVTVIEVPVVVLADGSPVRDLTADDFVLLQDGIEQSIVGFERVDLSRLESGGAVSEQPPVGLGGRRYFLLAFDLSHTQPVNALRAVAAARDLIQEGLHPTDLVGVSVYGAAAGARLLHPFTANHQEVEAALLVVEAVTSRDPAVLDRAALEAENSAATDALRRFLVEIRSFMTQQGVGLESTVGPAGEWLRALGADGGGGLAGAILAEILAEMEAEYQKGNTNVVRDRSLDLLETLADLAAALKDVRGQKYFVLFSEGIDESVLENPFDSMGKRQLANVMDSFRRSGWIVQSVDVGRPNTNTRGMFLLVEGTGGDQFQNYNDLSQAMGRMLEQTGVSYVLSFQPPELALDGRYHEIEVRLKKPAGVKVRHRDGYYAPQPSSAEERDELVAAGDRIASYRDGGAFEVAGMAAPFKLADSTALVPVVLEIHGPSLVEGGHERELVDLQVDAYLLDEHLGATPLSGKRVAVDLAQHGELVATGGLKILTDYRLAPGEHRLRFVINDAALNRRAVATMVVSVPDYQNDKPHVLEPFFPETSMRWLLVNLTELEAERDASFPFHFGERKFVPQVRVTLDRDQVVPICLVAFNLPSANPDLQLELSAADGSPLESGLVQIASAPESTADGTIRIMARLDTAGLAAGEYWIRVSHREDENGVAVESSRRFRVR